MTSLSLPLDNDGPIPLIGTRQKKGNVQTAPQPRVTASYVIFPTNNTVRLPSSYPRYPLSPWREITGIQISGPPVLTLALDTGNRDAGTVDAATGSSCSHYGCRLSLMTLSQSRPTCTSTASVSCCKQVSAPIPIRTTTGEQLSLHRAATSRRRRRLKSSTHIHPLTAWWSERWWRARWA